jgi:Domain of unknown function (DUF3576)
MSLRHYRLLLALAASLPLILAGCSASPPETGADRIASAAPAHPAARQAKSDAEDTDETLWTWLGFARRQPEHSVGPQTGATVSPLLWQATHDALHFAGVNAEDPITGVVETKWYSPPDKPDERLRVTVFILSRVLRSDSIAISVTREVRGPDGTWRKTPVAREVVAGIDNAILMRARHLHAERYREMHYD